MQLEKEGIERSKIFQVGDVMFDAVRYYNIHNSKSNDVINQYHLNESPYCLVTIHRAENTDSMRRLNHICEALIELSNFKQVVLPLHPRTKNMLSKTSWYTNLQKQLTIIEPVGYLDMLALENNAEWIITDSGGVQKEAYFCRVPCITLRNETEWVELVESGWNYLLSPDSPFSLIDHISSYKVPEIQEDLYGDGHAAEKIIQTMLATQQD